MPIYDYKCTDGHIFEELVRGTPDTISCSVDGCTCLANRETVYAVVTIGPVSDGLEAFNKTLLSPKERAMGMELKTKSQIENYERMKGYTRVDPDSVSTKAAISDCLDDHHDIMDIKKNDGQRAAADHVYKTEMQQELGWNNAKYTNWKRSNDIATDGRVKLESVDRGSAKKPSP